MMIVHDTGNIVEMLYVDGWQLSAPIGHPWEQLRPGRQAGHILGTFCLPQMHELGGGGRAVARFNAVTI